MKKRSLAIAMGIAVAASVLPAQVGGGAGGGGGFGVGGARGGAGVGMPADYQQFQQAGTIGVATARGGVTVYVGNNNAQTVTGRPVSANEERKSEQTLGDGTVISTSDSNRFYRDSEGRTRVEETTAAGTTVRITQPSDARLG